MKDFKGLDYKEVTSNKEKLVLIDFFATWCGPCKMLTPVLEELASEREDVEIYKIDVDQNRDLAIERGIRSVPTLVLYRDGVEVGEKKGYRPKEELVAWFDEHK